jgi:hypothetical protein
LLFHKYQLKVKILQYLKEEKEKPKSQSLIIVIMMIKKMKQEEVMQPVEKEVKDHH